jgi:peptidoglycan/LPS O-acetylase OafA/YrhL
MIHHFFLAAMLGAPELALLIPIAGMVLAGVIIVAGLVFKYHQRRLWHETARAALEKGQPPPPYPGAQADDITKSWHEFAMSQMAAHHHCRRPRWRRDLRGGLVLLAIGLAVYFARPPDWTPGWNLAVYIPGFMGGALLLNALFNAVFSPKETETDTRPPHRDPS